MLSNASKTQAARQFIKQRRHKALVRLGDTWYSCGYHPTKEEAELAVIIAKAKFDIFGELPDRLFSPTPDN
jgi:hypothetical protein